MIMQRSAFAVFLVTLGLSFTLQTSAATDQSLLNAARAQQPAVIQSLRDMVNIESGSDDAAGLERMADYATTQLKALGATVTRIPATNGKPPGSVEGVFKGSGKLRIMLIGHMDTVYRKGILHAEPYHRDGNELYGPGIADDKGGIATILGTLAILKQQGWKNYAQITVLFDPDEEIGSPGSGKIIANRGAKQDVVLSYEPSPAKAVAGHEGVLLKAAGTGSIRLAVQGRAAHAGAASEEGRNALIELAHQLLQTRELASRVPGTQMNWTMAESGTARNQIPERATATSDVRFTESGAAEKLLDAVKAKVAEHHLVPDATDEVTLEIARPMYDAGPRGLALAKLAQSVYGGLDAGDLAAEPSREMPGGELAFSGRNLLLLPGTTGGTDAGFAGSSGKAAVLESLGLAGWGYHARDEYIEIDSIVPRLYLSARMLMELGRQAEAGKLP